MTYSQLIAHDHAAGNFCAKAPLWRNLHYQRMGQITIGLAVRRDRSSGPAQRRSGDSNRRHLEKRPAAVSEYCL